MDDLKSKKDYLNQYQSTQKQIKGLIREIEQWQRIAENASAAISGGGSSNHSNNSKVETGAVNVADILTAIQADIDKLYPLRQEIKAAIDKCPKYRHRTLLTYRYINGLSINAIAKQEKKEPKTIINTIDNAIRKLEI